VKKWKCREAGNTDAYYTLEVREPAYTWDGPADAASLYAEDRCANACEYGDMDVEVLIDGKWVTYEVAVRSVPEFVASKKRGVEPKPFRPTCANCGEEFDSPTPAIPNEHCDPCHKKLYAEEDE